MRPRPDIKQIERLNELSQRVIGAAIEVHRYFGPGLLESSYEACLEKELQLQHIQVERQVPLPLIYKGLPLEAGYRIGLKVEGVIILELKAVEKLERIHQAQLLTYLRLSGLRLGLLINFNVSVLKDGIKRMLND